MLHTSVRMSIYRARFDGWGLDNCCLCAANIPACCQLPKRFRRHKIRRMTRKLIVHLLPVLVEPAALKEGVAVVLDVLRASTTMIHALGAGAMAVIPCEEVEAARQLAAKFAVGRAVLGGERGGSRIAGFDLDNSPAAYSSDRVGGKTVVFTTTNGTRALARASMARRVLVGGFVNLNATVDLLLRESGDVHIVCAGTDGSVTLEDCLCAGAMVAGVCHGTDGRVRPDDAAQMTAALFEQCGRQRSRLRDAMRTSRGGANLLELGFAADIEAALQWDQFDIVPELSREPWQIRPAGDAVRAAGRWTPPPI